jgi:cold shock CspA family protein
MNQGTVKFFNETKGFGFIKEIDSDSEHFVHISDLIDRIKEGDKVEFELSEGKKVPQPRVATLRKINKINTSELIDEGIILWFPGPESYTGEDMAEIQVHGSKAVVEALHSSISKIENCRLAEPGEFTKP